MVKKLCNRCFGNEVDLERFVLGYTTCMPCGEAQARKRKHTVVPLHKSNYIKIEDLEDLKGINNKGGLYR